jgi:MoxR-like ATPase
MPELPEFDWRKPIKLVDRPGLPEQYHLFDEPSAMAIRAALAARRPLLVRGEPGVGKTQLAAAAASVLKRPLLSRVVDSRTESRDLLWEFDAIMRLADAQIAAAVSGAGPRGEGPEGAEPGDAREQELRTRLAIANYVRPGPFWWAFDWSSAAEQATRTGTPAPPLEAGADPANGCVVLIDEIDKADTDVPNGLLETLGSGRFTPLGRSRPVEVQGEPPLVVITTNEERVLPNAFLRRCLILALKLPDDDDPKLIEHLVRIAAVHFPTRARASSGAFEKAARMLVEDRRVARGIGNVPLPGQAEYLDLLRAVFRLEDNSPEEQEKLLESVARFAVRKFKQDLP